MGTANTLEKTLLLGKIEGKRRKMRCLDSFTDSVDMNLSKLWERVKDRVSWCTPVHRVTKSRTWLSDWTTTMNFSMYSILAWRIPRMGEAWWAAVYGVSQSRTWLKRLSSSSSIYFFVCILISIIHSNSQRIICLPSFFYHSTQRLICLPTILLEFPVLRIPFSQTVVAGNKWCTFGIKAQWGKNNTNARTALAEQVCSWVYETCYLYWSQN